MDPADLPPAICPSTAHATKTGIPHALTWLESRIHAMRGTERWTQTNHPNENLRNPSRAYPKGMFTVRAAHPMRAIRIQGACGRRGGAGAVIW